MKKNFMNLHIFDEGGQGGNGGQGNTGNNGNGNQENAGGTFTYEQLEEIATSRATRAEQAALKSYFSQQGLSEEEAKEALEKFKKDREEKKPNLSAVEKERDDALKELAQIKNTNILRDKGVKADDLEYVMFKVEKMVDDKTDFEKAAEKFLKENPRFAGQGYKVSTSVATGTQGASDNTNSSINNAIRNAIRR